eukprot:4028979-Amphidinium_carterae.1
MTCERQVHRWSWAEFKSSRHRTRKSSTPSPGSIGQVRPSGEAPTGYLVMEAAQSHLQPVARLFSK